MRVLLLSFLVLFLAIALGVFAHHTITTGTLWAGIALILSTAGACSAVSRVVYNAAKKESRLWPKIASSLLYLFAAWAFLDLLRLTYLPLSLKIAYAVTGTVFVFWAALLLLSRANKNA